MSEVIRGKCSNIECKQFDKEYFCDDNTYCCFCKEETMLIIEKREFVKTSDIIIEGEHTFNYLKFNSLSPEEKKKILRKRSSEHFVKSGLQEQKIIKNRHFMREAKGL